MVHYTQRMKKGTVNKQKITNEQQVLLLCIITKNCKEVHTGPQFAFSKLHFKVISLCVHFLFVLCYSEDNKLLVR